MIEEFKLLGEKVGAKKRVEMKIRKFKSERRKMSFCSLKPKREFKTKVAHILKEYIHFMIKLIKNDANKILFITSIKPNKKLKALN